MSDTTKPSEKEAGSTPYSTYKRDIYYSREEKVWVAVAPELERCVVTAPSPAEALAGLEKEIPRWLDCQNNMGRFVPEPIADRDLKGRVVLRMSRRLHRELWNEAQGEGVSLNQYLLWQLAARPWGYKRQQAWEALSCQTNPKPPRFGPDRPARLTID